MSFVVVYKQKILCAIVKDLLFLVDFVVCCSFILSLNISRFLLPAVIIYVCTQPVLITSSFGVVETNKVPCKEEEGNWIKITWKDY